MLERIQKKLREKGGNSAPVRDNVSGAYIVHGKYVCRVLTPSAISIICCLHGSEAGAAALRGPTFLSNVKFSNKEFLIKLEQR
jgi:hypothetical protein